MEVVSLPAVGLKRSGEIAFFRGFVRSYRAAATLFKTCPPQAALAMGGFASAPPILAAKRGGAWTFLHESNTILRYIAETKGGEELYPRSPKLRANVDRMLDVLGCTFRPRVAPLERRRFINFPHGARDIDDERKIEGNVRLALDGVEVILADPAAGGFATGPFSIADCAWGPTLRRLNEMEIDLSVYPKILAWTQNVLMRPTWQRVKGPELEPRPWLEPGE